MLVNLVQKGECWAWLWEAWVILPLGVTFFTGFFCFHKVKSLLPILALLPTLFNEEKTRIGFTFLTYLHILFKSLGFWTKRWVRWQQDSFSQPLWFCSPPVTPTVSYKFMLILLSHLIKLKHVCGISRYLIVYSVWDKRHLMYQKIHLRKKTITPSFPTSFAIWKGNNRMYLNSMINPMDFVNMRNS